MSRFTHENNYKDGDTELAIGNRLWIGNGTSNSSSYRLWIIAGFDIEYNQVSADGTTYMNGYGIALIPNYRQTDNGYYNSNNDNSTGYYGSTMHNNINNSNQLAFSIIQNHLVNRYVMLSNSLDSNGKANKWIWTNAIATALSYKQITGDMISTIADTGEANYQLPLFKYERISNNMNYWIRDIYNLKQSYYIPSAEMDTKYSYLYTKKVYIGNVYESKAYREMIYIR